MVFAVGLNQRLEDQEKTLTVPQANPLARPNILGPSRPAHGGASAAPFPGKGGLSAREENSGPVRKSGSLLRDARLLGGLVPRVAPVTEAGGETPNVP